MKDNKVINWSYDKPTETGTYLVCYGDIESISSMRLVDVYKTKQDDILRAAEQDGSNITVDAYAPHWKWARLSFVNE